LRTLLARSINVGYVPVLVISMALMFARTLFAAKLVDVSEFGLFGLGVLVSNSFCMLSCFGFYLILQRDLPKLIAKRRHIRGRVILHQALVLALVSFICFLPLAFAGMFSTSPLFFAISLLNGLAQQIFLVVTLQSRCEGRSMRFAIDNLLRAFWLIIAMGLSGWITKDSSMMLLAESLVTIAIAVRIYYTLGNQHKIEYKVLWMGAIHHLSKVNWASSLTLMATGILAFAILNGDRWIAASLLHRDDYALYTFVGIILILSQSLQSVINVSVFPMLARRYALRGNKNAAQHAIKYSIITLLITLFLSIPAILLTKEIIKIFFLEYASSQFFLPLFFLIGSIRVSDFLTSYLIIAGKERILLVINVFSFVLPALTWVYIFRFNLTQIDSLSIALFALSIAIFNYASCLLVTIYSMKVESR